MEKNNEVHIAIFASGEGSNALAIIKYFKDKEHIAKPALIVSSHKNAGVIQKAINLKLPYHILDKTQFYNTTYALDVLKAHCIDFIVLAGFIWYVPAYIVNAYHKKILNIHPALLPKYGGKGMYGIYVHEKVIQNKEKESGLTIHFVNEQYDAGEIVFQYKCPVYEHDTPHTLQSRIKALEHFYYPRIIEKIIRKTFNK